MQTVTVEPEWDEQERDYMTAFQAWEDSLCPICGGDPEECQSMEAERAWAGVPPVRCHKTDAILRYQGNADKYERDRALLWRAEKRSS